MYIDLYRVPCNNCTLSYCTNAVLETQGWQGWRPAASLLRVHMTCGLTTTKTIHPEDLSRCSEEHTHFHHSKQEQVMRTDTASASDFSNDLCSGVACVFFYLSTRNVWGSNTGLLVAFATWAVVNSHGGSVCNQASGFVQKWDTPRIPCF